MSGLSLPLPSHVGTAKLYIIKSTQASHSKSTECIVATFVVETRLSFLLVNFGYPLRRNIRNGKTM